MTITPKKIVLIGHGRHEEALAVAALKPGHLLELVSTGKVQKNSVAGARGEILIAKEDSYQGNTITTAYAADDVVSYHVAYRGDVAQALLAAAAVAVVIGDQVCKAADGTVRKAGPAITTLYDNVADATAHSNTTDAADFDKSYTVPANTLQVGDRLRIRAAVKVPNTNSSDTLTLLLQIGGNTIATSGAVNVTDNDIGYFDAEVVVQTIGSGGSFQASGLVVLGVPGTAPVTAFNTNDASFDTTAANKIAVNADWSAASSGDSASLTMLTVELERNNEPVAVALEAVDNSAGGSEAFVKVRFL